MAARCDLRDVSLARALRRARLGLLTTGAALALWVAGCGAAPAAKAAPAAGGAGHLRPSSAGELSPALAPLAFWLGDWHGQDGASEHWIAAAGALYGVALDGRGGFEVMIVDDAEGAGPADGKLRFWAMPGGSPAVRFERGELRDQGITFVNPRHDFPQQIAYWREGPVLHAEISGGGQAQAATFSLGDAQPAPELEAADLAFAADTAARGIEGWLAAFEPGGWQLLRDKKATGDDIRREMGPFLAQTRITWAPAASQRKGDLGFTIGTATFTSVADGSSWRGTYVTLWHRQPDGSWKVRFDTGRVVNEASTQGGTEASTEGSTEGGTEAR
ncbi:MAG: nuclear transport factor 2 family protein [Myxococcales bacterium]|nr:nuclear transport factor 2 family protein [Myxococcales bacterium]